MTYLIIININILRENFPSYLGAWSVQLQYAIIMNKPLNRKIIIHLLLLK